MDNRNAPCIQEWTDNVLVSHVLSRKENLLNRGAHLGQGEGGLRTRDKLYIKFMKGLS